MGRNVGTPQGIRRERMIDTELRSDSWESLASCRSLLSINEALDRLERASGFLLTREVIEDWTPT